LQKEVKGGKLKTVYNDARENATIADVFEPVAKSFAIRWIFFEDSDEE
jgi:hypothetical protein